MGELMSDQPWGGPPAQPQQPGGPQPRPPGPPAGWGQWQPPVSAAPSSPRRWPWIAGIIAAFILGVGVGAAGGSGDSEPTAAGLRSTATVTAQPNSTAEPVETEPTYRDPTEDDFELSVKTLEKECFGSAGCNVTFRIEVAFAGDSSDLDPSKTYEVTYEIRGGEDPLINTLTVSGDEYQVDDNEFISTASSGAKLKAVVTDVSER